MKIQRFIHETSPLSPDLSLSIQPTLDSSCQSAVTPVCDGKMSHFYKVKSRESDVYSILLIIQRTSESFLLQLLTACHSRADPRQFGALELLLASLNHHYMLSVGFLLLTEILSMHIFVSLANMFCFPCWEFPKSGHVN